MRNASRISPLPWLWRRQAERGGGLPPPPGRPQRADPVSCVGVGVQLLRAALDWRLLRRRTVRAEFARQLMELGVKAWWIVVVPGLLGYTAAYLLLGGVYAPLYALYVPALLGRVFIGYAVPLIVAILVIGHSLVRMTAELASMGAGQELDSLEALGIKPVEDLLLPRALALVVATPALTLLGIFAAGAGGVLGALLRRTDLSGVFLDRFLAGADWPMLLSAGAKQALSGAAMSCIGGYYGLRVRQEEPGGMGRAATGSVLWSVLVVVLLQVIFALLEQPGLP